MPPAVADAEDQQSVPAVTFDSKTVVGLDDKPIPPIKFDNSTAVDIHDKPIQRGVPAGVSFDSSTIVGLDDKPIPLTPYQQDIASRPGLPMPSNQLPLSPDETAVAKQGPEGGWGSVAHNLGLPTSVAEANLQGQQEDAHPIRTAFEAGPGVAQIEGLGREFVRSTGEAGKAIESGLGWKPGTNVFNPQKNNTGPDPYSAIAHAVQAIPFVGAGIEHGAEQQGAQPSGTVLANDPRAIEAQKRFPAVLGTVATTAAQAAPLYAGGWEALRNGRAAELRGEPAPPPSVPPAAPAAGPQGPPPVPEVSASSPEAAPNAPTPAPRPPTPTTGDIFDSLAEPEHVPGTEIHAGPKPVPEVAAKPQTQPQTTEPSILDQAIENTQQRPAAQVPHEGHNLLNYLNNARDQLIGAIRPYTEGQTPAETSALLDAIDETGRRAVEGGDKAGADRAADAHAAVASLLDEAVKNTQARGGAAPPPATPGNANLAAATAALTGKPLQPAQTSPSGNATAPKPDVKDLAAKAIAAVPPRPVAPQEAPKPLQPAAAQATNQPQPVGKPEATTGRPILQSTDNPATLQKAAATQAPWLEQQANATVQGVPGAKVEGVREKKEAADLGEKLQKEGQPAETIPDYLGGRIVVDSPQARDQVVQKIKSTMPVIREQDNFEKGSDPYGFRSHTFQVRTPDGNSAELQVVPKEMAEVNDNTHPLYENAENARLNGNEAKHQEMVTRIKNVHDQAMRRFNERNKRGIKRGDRVRMGDGSLATITHVDAKRGMVGVKKDNGQSFPVVPMDKLRPEKPEVGQSSPSENQPVAGGVAQPASKPSESAQPEAVQQGQPAPGTPRPVGAPIPKRVEQIKELVAKGQKVVIFSAEADNPAVHEALAGAGLGSLPVTNIKGLDFGAILDNDVNVVPDENERMDIPYVAPGKSLYVDFDDTLFYGKGAHPDANESRSSGQSGANDEAKGSGHVPQEEAGSNAGANSDGRSKPYAFKLISGVDPNSLVFREAEQHSLDGLRESFPDGEYDPITAIRGDDGKLHIIDGHNRAAAAIEDRGKLQVVEIIQRQYDALVSQKFDDMEISAGLLAAANEDSAWSRLVRQFAGSNIEKRSEKVQSYLLDQQEELRHANQSGVGGSPNADAKTSSSGEKTSANEVTSAKTEAMGNQPGGSPEVRERDAAGRETAGKSGTSAEAKPLDGQGGGEGKEEVKPETKPAKPETKYKYGSTQADIPADSEAGKALAAARAKIDPDDLMPSTNTTDGSGLEEDSHITIRYGIDSDDTTGLRAFLEKQAPFEATLGKVTSFPPSEHSDGAAPIVVAIESADLRRLEKELDQHGKFIDRTFPDYKPHATLGYVKPDAAKKYVGMGGMEGKKFTVSSVSISNKDGSKTEVQLKGKPKPSFYKPPTPQVAPMAGTSPLGAKAKSPGTSQDYETTNPKAFAQGRAQVGKKYGEPGHMDNPYRPETSAYKAFEAGKSKPTLNTYEAEVSKYAGDPHPKTVQIEAENRRHAEQLLAEKYPGMRISSAGRVEKPVEKSVEKEETKPSSEAPHESTSRSEAGGGRPATDTGSRDREGVAEPPARVREESPEREPAEGTSPSNGAELHPSGERVRGTGTRSGPGEGSAASLDSSPAQPVVDAANKQQRKRTKLNQDWFETPEDWQAPTGTMARLDGNIAALEILRDVQKNPRKVTDDEKAKLAAYVGWGALSKVFDENYLRVSSWERREETAEKNRWREAHKKLKELLNPAEYDAARRSTQNAHYTSPDVVRFMWDAVKRMGFKSGNVLEPSIGVGNFFGMMPPEIRTQVNGVADELDPITHGIAQLLYPGATVFNKDFVELIIPDNEIDLAIGNVPFGEAVYDPKYPKMKARIHDYFFVKSMDKVKPGGMVAFITSTGTMNKASPAIRHILASQADLVTAFRLPSSAFKANAGTDVTTDVIFLRKRMPDEKPGGEPWIASSPMEVPVEDEDRTHPLNVNEFYQKHPENMLGTPTASGRMYGGLNFMLKPSDKPIDELLKTALAGIPKGVLGPASVSKASGMDTASTDANYAPDELKEYQYTVDKGALKQRIQGRLVRPASVIDKSGVVNTSKVDRIKAMVGLRDKLNALMAAMATMPDEESPNEFIALQREDLRKAYDSFVKQYGYLNSTYNGLFREDPHYPRLLALENYDKAKKKGEPADIFKKRTIFPRQPLKIVSDDPKEALQQIMGERGYPDVNLMAQLQGKEPKGVAARLVKDGLIFRDPVSGEYETREKYLSGYVRDKLDDAKKAVEQGLEEYKPNVKALADVQPKDLEISDDAETSISVRLGGTWIPIPALEQFFEETFKSGADIGYAGGTWNVAANSPWTPELVTEWSGGGVKGDELFQLALNQKQPTVYFPKNSDGTGGGIDAERTTGARAMQERIRNEFQKWAGKSKEWKSPLEKAYNYAFNNLVTTEYDGSHLTFPGMNPAIKLKAHQVNAVWRMLQDGKALLAHEVGAGKTFEMVAAVMEGKRVGLFKKPMLAVPNHIVDQFRKEFLLLYPGANILVPTEEDFDSKNRQRIMSQIATGDYDAIILPHSQFNLLDISPERQLVTIEKQMDELEETLHAMRKTAGKRDRSVKELEKAKEKLRTRIAQLRNLKADKAINFDDTGVDALFIDEAHEYKNLTFYTKMTRIAGIQQGNAKRALRLKMKTEYLQDKNKGRGVFFATGTPVQNTMAELYTMIKYVAPEVLEKAGIRFFDDWAANFGSTITAMELSADGRTFKARTKFARFQNVPELMQMFRSFADVKTAADLNLPRPELEGGKPIVVSVPGSELLDAYVKDLMDRAAHLPKDPKEDNMLKIVSEGRKAATDMRLLDQEIADERDSKINVAVRQIRREWEEGKEDHSTQMVFLDMYRATNAEDKELLNLYDDMRKKLIASGVPAHEIAVIGEHNTRLKRQALFDKMNAGTVRVLLGSTQKMGSGTNAQQKLKALHHIDLTWRPGDLTQREGRILRQGNENKTVRIYNYLTERSFDAYMAQTLQSKAEFLSQILSGRAKGRTALDAAADMVLSLEEMKVAASGNPDIKKKYDLEMRRSQLYSLEREFAAKLREVKWRAESAELSVASAKTRASALEKTQAKIDAIRGPEGEGFEMEVDGQKFTDRKAATEYLEAMKELPQGTFWMKVNGINVSVKPRVENVLGGKGEDGKTTHIEYALEYENRDHTTPEQTMASLGRSIESRLREIPSDIRRSQTVAEREEEDARRYREQLKKRDFPEKDELDKVEKDLREVEKRLGLGNINTGSQASGEEAQADVDAETPEEEPADKDEDSEDEKDEPEPGTLKPNKPQSDLGSTFHSGFADPELFKRLFPDFAQSIKEWASDEPTTATEEKELIRQKAGEMDRRVAIAVHMLKGASKAWRSRSHEESIRFWNAVESGDLSRLGPNDRKLAEVFAAAFDSMKAQLQKLKPELLRNYIENYFPHIWERPSQVGATVKGLLTGKRPLQGKASFLKQRTIPTMQDGLDLGFKPLSWNPVDSFLLKYAEMAQFLMAHQTLDVMKKSGTAKFVRGSKPAPDGWTLLDDRISTVWRPATMIDEDKVEDATYDKTYTGGKRPIPSIAIEDLEDAQYTGMVLAGHYYAPKGAAKVFNNYVSKGFAGRSTIFDIARWLNSNLNTLQLGVSAFHASMITGVGITSDLALGVQQLTEGKPVSFAKAAIRTLAFPVSALNTVRNGMKLMRSYLDPVKYPEMAKEAEAMAVAGGRLKENTIKIRALDTAINAFSNKAYLKGLSAIPGAILQSLTSPIMEHYVPVMKLGIFYGMAHDILDEHSRGKINSIQVRTRLDEAWNSVDNRAGQMVYRNLFWNRAVLDVLQVGTRSVGWNYGTFAEAFGAVKGTARAAVAAATGKKPRLTPSMAFALALPITTGLMGAASNYMRTGHSPDTWKDYFYIRNTDGVYLSPPTYMKDVFSYAHDPLGTLGHKAGPLAEATFELLQNKDFYGEEIRHKDDPVISQLAEVAEWAAKQTIPFSFSSAGKLLENRGAQQTLGSMLTEGIKHPGDIIAGQLGFTQAPAFIQHSDALNKAREYGQENRPSGTKTKQQAEKSQAMHTIEDMYRSKKVDKDAIAAFKKAGIISEVDLLRARLYSRSEPLTAAVSSLHSDQALNVYVLATPEEKKALRPLIELKQREINNDTAPDQRDALKKAYREALHPAPRFTGTPQS